MKTVTFILGTRPEAIKLAPVILRFKENPTVNCRVCVTGQHQQMLDQVLEVFRIKPDANLQLMRPNQSLAGLTARAIEALDKYLSTEKPDLVLVQGDTTTVLCAAIASFYKRVPVAHVEAGLRTNNLESPWPEEANRTLTSRIAKIHFAPTELAKRNLLREGIREDMVHVTGNTVIDALNIALDIVNRTKMQMPQLREDPNLEDNERRIVLITAHRRENFGKGFENICQAIVDLSRRYPGIDFVYPVHLNPNVQEPVRRILSESPHANIHLLKPLSYLPFVALMNRSTLILTDSGGIQEEATALSKPTVVMRDTSERTEAIDAGTAVLAGTDRFRIVDTVSNIIDNTRTYNEMAKPRKVYGDGTAANQIERVCLLYLDENQKSD